MTKRRGSALFIYIILLATMAIAASSVKNIGEYIIATHKANAKKLVSETSTYVDYLYGKGKSLIGADTSGDSVYNILDDAGFPGVCAPQSELTRVAIIEKIEIQEFHADCVFLILKVKAKKPVYPKTMRQEIFKVKKHNGTVVYTWNETDPRVLQVKITFYRGGV